VNLKQKSFLSESYLLWILLNQTRSAIFKARDKQTGRYVFPNQAAALIMIWASNGKATPTMLSRYLFLERHSVSELITRMEENNLVYKSKDQKLKSVVRITITPHGQEVCAHYMGREFIDEIMESLTEEQRTQLRTCLQVLFDNVCARLGVEPILPPLSLPGK
jgi:DNA-binding MarR family transcriptional regulator